MYVETLSVVDFRNYADAEASLFPGLNVLVGANGQGKTNLLEALFLAAGRNPPRFGGNSQLVRWGCTEARVEARAAGGGAQPVVRLEIGARGRRLLVNGTKARSVANSPITAAMFCPETLGLVKEGAQARRDLLDDLLERLQPAYAAVRSDYMRVVRQRNRVLQQAQSAPRQLDVWDARLLELGTEITLRRLWATAHVAPLVSEAYANLSGSSSPEASGSYRGRLVGEENAPESVARRFSEELARRQSEELARGITVVGPHRDDLVLTLGGHEMRGFGSQGEQRTAALALIIAEAHLLREATGEPPVLLLDDVLSELDEARRGRLLEGVAAEGQAVVTTTNINTLGAAAEAAHVLEIREGTITGE